MFEVLLSYLVKFGLESNVVCGNGVGPLLFAREKKYASFRYLSALFLVLGVVICSFLTYFLERFIYSKYDLEEIKIFVIVLTAGLYNLLIAFFWKKISHFGRYLYENSCAFGFDLVYITFVVLALDLTQEILPFALSVAAVVVVLFVMSVIVGFFVDRINSSNINVKFRNVSVRLCLFAIIATLVYYANLLIK